MGVIHRKARGQEEMISIQKKWRGVFVERKPRTRSAAGNTGEILTLQGHRPVKYLGHYSNKSRKPSTDRFKRGHVRYQILVSSLWLCGGWV